MQILRVNLISHKTFQIRLFSILNTIMATLWPAFSSLIITCVGLFERRAEQKNRTHIVSADHIDGSHFLRCWTMKCSGRACRALVNAAAAKPENKQNLNVNILTLVYNKYQSALQKSVYFIADSQTSDPKDVVCDRKHPVVILMLGKILVSYIKKKLGQYNQKSYLIHFENLNKNLFFI